jgi:hypothetical protein
LNVTESSLPIGKPTDKVLDTTQVTQTDGTVAEREGVFVGDPETAEARAKVGALFSTEDYALAVRDPFQKLLLSELRAQTQELRMIRLHLNQLTEFEVVI